MENQTNQKEEHISQIESKIGESPFLNYYSNSLNGENTKIKLKVIDYNMRPVSVTADHNEFRNIVEVKIESDQKSTFELLFDSNHSIEERILKEQFIE